MIYRTLGNTGLKVSQLGFGAMRLPMVGEKEQARVDRDLAIPLIHRAFEAGVNYIDSAVGYCNHDSQRAVGEALKGWRDKIVVSTKNHDYGQDEKTWWTNLEDSLRRLQVETIDIYNHHGLGWQGYVEHIEPRIAPWMTKARDQGLIRHICCSTHDTCENLIKLIDTGYVASVTLQYNILDRRLEDAIAHAHQRGVGVVVMGPVGGGRLGINSEVLADLVPGVRRVPELALRFVLSNPNVSVCLSGMSNVEQLDENVAVASDDNTLSDSDREEIHARLAELKSLADLYCTGCEYCLPCPKDVRIPEIFERYNWGRVYGLWEPARQHYDWIGNVPWAPGAQADACVECGACEDKCPQNIPIRQRLKEAHEALKKEGGDQPS